MILNALRSPQNCCLPAPNNSVHKATFISRILLKTFFCIPANIYLFKFNVENTRKIGEICSELTIKTFHSSVFIATLNMLYIFLVSVPLVPHCFFSHAHLKQCYKWVFHCNITQNTYKSHNMKISLNLLIRNIGRGNTRKFWISWSSRMQISKF